MPISETGAGISTAVAAAVAAVAGAWGTQRAKRADVAAQMLTEARAWADDFREAEQVCRQELAKVRAEVACLRKELDRLTRLLGDIGDGIEGG